MTLLGFDDIDFGFPKEPVIIKLGPFDGLNHQCGVYHNEFSRHLTPYACTFTLPNECEIPYIKNIMERVVDVEKQYSSMKFKLTTWVNAMDKLLPKSTPIVRAMFYCEHTKQKQIHAHGIVFINNNYYSGLSQLMAIQWSRIAKASIGSMKKTNARGMVDKAFDKCNNVNKWIEYIQKEQTVKDDYITEYYQIPEITDDDLSELIIYE